MFFGSALTNFGVEPFLKAFLRMAPAPSPRQSDHGLVHANDPYFSGFVFKIQANMDSMHRDRIAFMRICSGRFVKGMEARHVRLGKMLRLKNPSSFMARERTTIEEAFAGDIIGLYDPGVFRIGDTLTTDPSIRYHEIPRFPPEVFAYIRNPNPSKFKQYKAGLDQLLNEGVIQTFHHLDGATNVPLLGAVGQLQFEVVLYRMQNEYGAECRLEPTAFKEIRWFDPSVTENDVRDIFLGANVKIVRDIADNLVILFPDRWSVDYFSGKNPKLKLHHVSPNANPVHQASSAAE
jgi:peptide chain release factor 3